MGEGTNAREGASHEPAPKDSSPNVASHRVPAPGFDADPSATTNAQLAATPAERPWQFPSDVPTILSPGGDTLAGPEPHQATPTGDKLNSPSPPALSTSPRNDNNPFLKMLAHKSAASVGNPSAQSADELFGQMSLNEPGTNNPWATVASHGTGSVSVYDQSSAGGTDPWSSEPLQQSNTNSGPRQSASPAQGGEGELIVFDDEPSKPGNDANHEAQSVGSGRPAVVGNTSGPINETPEGSSLGDRDSRRGASEATEEHGLVEASKPKEPTASTSSPRGPALLAGDSQAVPVPPPRAPAREATEMYHIVRISWHDHGAQHNPRTSPILVQNANGPCPIVALVNALVLATPADATDTPLTHALLSREQISIDLLLQAVVEELTGSPRRPSDAALPDLIELYRFLKGLDTGMNANPRFVPSEDAPPDFLREWLADLTPSERQDSIPGGFEQTREMELYSTFSIPLVHGWLPRSSDLAYESMKRRAESYEEVQHFLFQEEELQKTLEDPTSSGLTPEEQSIYQDIQIIKDFLHASATQLTATGLDVLKRAMPTGSVAILFRNDHFSTLYKHPETHGLLMLVTDSEFAGHNGIVWETFDDITGKSEFLSGDFKPVRGAAQRASGDRGSSARLSASSYGRGASSADSGHAAEAPRSPNLEQEDQDFAMALQLQEEEDERHRQERQAARQREQQLSGQYMDPQGRHPVQPQISGRLSTTPNPGTGLRRPSRPASAQQVVRPLVPPANGSAAVGRPAVHRVGEAGGAGEAPPSYDQSANDTPFRPPPGHPSHAASAPGATSPAAQQPLPSQQAYQGARPAGLPTAPGAAGATWYGNSARPARRPAALGGRERDRDRDCTVM